MFFFGAKCTPHPRSVAASLTMYVHTSQGCSEVQCVLMWRLTAYSCSKIFLFLFYMSGICWWFVHGGYNAPARLFCGEVLFYQYSKGKMCLAGVHHRKEREIFYYRNTWCLPTSEHIRVPQRNGSSELTLADIPLQTGVVVYTLKKLTSLIE